MTLNEMMYFENKKYSEGKTSKKKVEGTVIDKATRRKVKSRRVVEGKGISESRSLSVEDIIDKYHLALVVDSSVDEFGQGADLPWSDEEDRFDCSDEEIANAVYNADFSSLLQRRYGLSSLEADIVQDYVIDQIIRYYGSGSINESKKVTKEDTVKKSNGKWTNRGDDGTEHGEFDTKKEADAQRKAMYANGYKGESFVGDDLSKYQKWVDYDMKRYGKISKKTQGLVSKAGLEIVKDDHGDYEVIAKEESCGKKLGESYSGLEDTINQLLVDLFNNLGVNASDDIRFDEIVDKISDVCKDNLTEVNTKKALSRLDKRFTQVHEDTPNQYPFPDGTRQYSIFITDDPDEYKGFVISIMGPDWANGERNAVNVNVEFADDNDEYLVNKKFKYKDIDKAVDLANKLVNIITPGTTEEEFGKICTKYGLLRE